MISELAVEMLDRTFGRPLRHLATLTFALEVEFDFFRGRHDSLPPDL
jgi:hypothetical protein